ncbi:MAG TPA: BTAD domain-containing putative transcriptional regulator, partial [Actinomycetota bacterium]|nr:BTAD domain-containing putative transcriptional regulator [Actinomycetota bacterium]
AAGLTEQRLAAYEQLAEAELAVGQHEPLVAQLRPLVAAHPLRERLVAPLMIALAACGQQAEALRVFAETRSRLVDELGVEPGPELAAAQQRVLRQQVGPTAPAGATPVAPAPATRPAQLPADIAVFTGRAAYLRQLDALVPDERADAPVAVVISAIDGTAGIGKTALAVHWARRVADRFRDGQLYVNLRGFSPSGPPVTPAEALRGFFDGLDVPPQRIPEDLGARSALYRSLLEHKRMLILLDNARDAEQVRPLLPGSPGCLVVVTSRNRLTSLVAVEGAQPLTLDLLATEEARRLLGRRLGPARVAAEPAAVDEIIAACARLPLALAIVAAHAATQPRLPLAALAGQLRSAGSRLDPLVGEDPVSDVRTVFSWSYGALDAAAARLFRLLGLHPGPDLAVGAAASLAGIPVSRAASLLAVLGRAHLVTEHSPGRYTFHDLLRAYATEQAYADDSEADRRAAVHRLLDHYLNTAYAAARLLDPHRSSVTPAPARSGVSVTDLATHEAALSWLTTEHRVLTGAVTLAAAAGFDVHAWQLAAAMTEFLERRGHWHDWIATNTVALAAAARLGDRSAQAPAHRGLARAHALLGHRDDARQHLEQALRLFVELDDRIGQATTRLSLGGLLAMHGRHREALGHARDALELFHATGYLDGQARALNNIGWYHAQLGDYESALSPCLRALELQREIGDRRGEADTWDSLGYVYHHLGRYREATTTYGRSLELYRELGDRYSEADSLNHAGETHHAAGDVDAARRAWQLALTILEQLNHPDAERVRARLRPVTATDHNDRGAIASTMTH